MPFLGSLCWAMVNFLFDVCHQSVGILRIHVDWTFKKILVDNHYKAICWPVRSESSSCTVVWSISRVAPLLRIEIRPKWNYEFYCNRFFMLNRFFSSRSNVHGTNMWPFNWLKSIKLGSIVRSKKNSQNCVPQITNSPNQIYSQW